MNTKYLCEECGKTFATEEEALQCEREHEEFKKAAEAAEAERKGRLDEIKTIEALLNSKIKAYEETYGLRCSTKPRTYVPSHQLSRELSDMLDELFW